MLPAPGLVHLQHEADSFKVEDVACASLLAGAVATHSTMTSLIAPQMSAAAMRAFAAALPSSPPTSLRELNMYIDAHPGGTTAVAETFWKLPLLEHAFVDVYLDGEPPAGASSAAASVSSLQALARYATHPAKLPKLAYIEICESAVDTNEHISCVPELLSFICAPRLKRIVLGLHDSVMEMRVLLNALSRFSALEWLKVSTNAPTTRKVVLQPVAGSALPTLPTLRNAEVRATHACTPLLVAATAARAAQGTLTALAVSKDEPEGDERVPEGLFAVRDAFATFWAAVGGCSQLRMLEVGWLCGVPSTESSPVVCSTALAGCLKKLPHLVSLVLEGHDVQYTGSGVVVGTCALDGDVLAPGIQALTGLEKLRLCHGSGVLSLDSSEEFVSAFLACTRLRELWLCVDGMSSVSVLVPAIGLRNLTQLVVPRQVIPDREYVEKMYSHRNNMSIVGCKLHLADGRIGVHDLPDTCYDI